MLFACGQPCLADEPFAEFEQAVVDVLQTTYADAALRDDKEHSNTRSFTANMRSFTVYPQNKTGDWLEPGDMMAPDRGGISVQFKVTRGTYEGAAVVPVAATEDLYLFKRTYVIRNSADGEWHVWAEILTPREDSPYEVRVALVQLFYDFERFL